MITAKELVALREEKGISRAELSRKSKVPYFTLMRFEQGHQKTLSDVQEQKVMTAMSHIATPSTTGTPGTTTTTRTKSTRGRSSWRSASDRRKAAAPELPESAGFQLEGNWRIAAHGILEPADDKARVKLLPA